MLSKCQCIFISQSVLKHFKINALCIGESYNRLRLQLPLAVELLRHQHLGSITCIAIRIYQYNALMYIV